MAKPKLPVGEIAIERNITQRCDGFAFRVRMMAHGLRFDETFHSLQEARAFRDRKRADIALDPTAQLIHAARLARQSAHLTLGELLKRYQTEVTPAKKGARAERLRINKLLRFPVAQLPARFPADDINGFAACDLIQPRAQDGVGRELTRVAGELEKGALGDLLGQLRRPDLAQGGGKHEGEVSADDLREGILGLMPGVAVEQLPVALSRFAHVQ